MNYDKIRNMSDEELENFMKKVKNRGSKTCYKCGKTTKKVLLVKDIEFSQTRTLIGLCNYCYKDLLKKLEINDIDWY